MTQMNRKPKKQVAMTPEQAKTYQAAQRNASARTKLKMLGAYLAFLLPAVMTPYYYGDDSLSGATKASRSVALVEWLKNRAQAKRERRWGRNYLNACRMGLLT